MRNKPNAKTIKNTEVLIIGFNAVKKFKNKAAKDSPIAP
jgi:hypothetical protein